MKNYKTIAIIFYLCAVAFYIIAIINIFDSAQRSMWIIWLCIGSMWLCLGSVFNKTPNEDDDLDKDDK